MNVQLPDGTVIQDVPDGMSKADLIVKLKANGHDTSGLETPPAPSMADKISNGIRSVTGPVNDALTNTATGLARGAARIGTVLLKPTDALQDYAFGDRNPTMSSLVTGKVPLTRNQERVQGIEGAMDSLGADKNSSFYKSGDVGSQIAGTSGAAGILGKAAQFLGAAPSVVNALSSGGMSLGGQGASGAMGAIGNALTRAGAGAATGAAQVGLVDPSNIGTGAIVGGVLPGAVQASGAIGNALSNVAQSGANRLMQSAIKPTIAQLRTGDAQTAVDTLLKYGISPTKGGVDKLKTMIDDHNTQIADLISNSNGTVSKQKVLDTLGDVRSRFTNQVSPTSDLNAINNVADDFTNHPALGAGDAIPVQAAQQMKQGTYGILAKKYGQVGTAETEAQKGLARGLKEGVADAVPEVAGLNAEESKLLTTLSVAERRALMEMNKNPVGLTMLAHNPAAAIGFMADRSAAFKALAARIINRATPMAGNAGQAAIGMAQNPLLRSGAAAIEANP